MRKIHWCLRVSTNIVFILIWGTLSLIWAINALPHAWEVFVAAIVLGAISGIMQWKGLNEAKSVFLEAQTRRDVQATFRSTKWGRRYMYFVWGRNILLILLPFAVGGNPNLSILMGFFTMMFVRELTTFIPTFQLRQFALQYEPSPEMPIDMPQQDGKETTVIHTKQKVMIWVTLIFVAVFIATFSSQVNRHLDSKLPVVSALTVERIGKYYQPFQVDYFVGKTALSEKNLRISVLHELAEKTSIGDRVLIVMGNGLLKKSWVAIKEKYEDYNTLSFKIVNIGLFLICLIVGSIGYFQSSFPAWGKKKSIALYLISCFTGIVAFYLV